MKIAMTKRNGKGIGKKKKKKTIQQWDVIM